MAAAMPAVAVIVAGAISAVRSQRARVALVAIAAIGLGYQTLNHVTSITPGFLPQNISLKVSSYSAVIHLGDEPIGDEQLPGPDYATPIVDYLERAVERGPDSLAAHSVCLLETEPVVNDSTLGFIAAAHKDPTRLLPTSCTPRRRHQPGQCSLELQLRDLRPRYPPSPNLETCACPCERKIRRPRDDATPLQAVPRPQPSLLDRVPVRSRRRRQVRERGGEGRPGPRTHQHALRRPPRPMACHQLTIADIHLLPSQSPATRRELRAARDWKSCWCRHRCSRCARGPFGLQEVPVQSP